MTKHGKKYVEAGVKEENIDYIVAGDQANCSTVADKLVNGGNDLIYAIATPALQSVAAATTDIPIVGCAITDYTATKLVKSNDEPGGNVTGASDLTPVKDQFDLMHKLLPDAKKVRFSCDGKKIKGSEGGHDLIVMCNFSYSLDGKKYESLGVPFQAREGQWIGAKVGMFCTRPKGVMRYIIINASFLNPVS